MTIAPGYAGRLLEVDLTSQTCTAREEDPAALRKYVGGACLGGRILLDESPPGAAWSDPANRIILATGPLAGTRVMGSGNFSVVTKGALTEGPTSTQANGFLGAYLRFAGFDAIIIHGRAAHLSYLYLHDGKAEVRDAQRLAGKDTWETEDLIKNELGSTPQGMSVFAIGPAGEKLVRFAALVGDRGHVAGHNGTGAVMGAKNLKAVAAARGRGGVKLHDSAALSQLSKKMFETVKADPGGWGNNYQFGTLWLTERNVRLGRLPCRNYTTSVCPMTPDQLNTFSPQFLREHLSVKPHPCWACQMHHCHLITIPEGPLAGREGEEPEYEGFAAMGPQLGIYDWAAATSLSNEVDRLGLDVNETGWLLGMVIESYEKGVITGADTGGREMRWGNVAAVRGMLDDIVNRRGFGDVLAQGTMRAAMVIGGQAPQFGVHSMSGNTPVSHDHRRAWNTLFDMCVSNTGTSEIHLAPRAAAVGLTEPGAYAATEVARVVAATKGITPFIDSLGVCRQANREVPELLVAMLNAATGWDFTWEEARKVGLRAVNLLRAFNIRRGYATDVEMPSPRYGSPLPDGADAGRSIRPVLNEMLDVYYGEMGWDRASGKPLPETLRSLGLEDVIRHLWPQP